MRYKFTFPNLEVERKNYYHLARLHYNEAHTGLFCCTISGNRRNSHCTIPVSTLNVTFPLHENVSSFYCFHLSHSSFPSSWNLCLPHIRALSGNDVNRVKCFREPRGRTTWSDFGEWLTSAEKYVEENTLMFFIFLQLFFLFVTHVCARHTSVVRFHVHLVLCSFAVFSTLEGEFLVFSITSSLYFFFSLSFFLSFHKPLIIATSLSENLHKTSDLQDEPEPSVGRWDIN